MAFDPRKDERRRCMPMAEWPAQDRTAWEAAIRLGDPIEGIGPAAHWRDGTRRKVTSSYGRWLTFLSMQNFLDIMMEPQERVTPEHLRTYVTELQDQLSPATVASRITDLRETLRVMGPEHPVPLLEHVHRVLLAQARPFRDKRTRLVASSTLFETGLRLMDEAEKMPAPRDDWRACRYRDGLMVAILAARAPRRRNLHNIRLGQNLQRIGARYVLSFAGAETKNHRPLEGPLPSCLTPRIDRYLVDRI